MSRRPRRRLGTAWIFTPVWSGLLGALLYLDTSAVRSGPAPVVAPSAQLSPGWAQDFHSRLDRVTAAVTRLPLQLSPARDEPQGAGALRWVHRRYDAAQPQTATVESIARSLESLRRAASGVDVQVDETRAGAEAHIGIDGLLTHTIAFRWQEPPPRVAVIVGGLGDNLLAARELMDLPAAVTLAVLPFRPFSHEVARLAQLFGRELLLDVDDAEPSPDTDQQVRSGVAAARDPVGAVDRALAAVPDAVGLSLPATWPPALNRTRLQPVLQRATDQQLFVIDRSTDKAGRTCDEFSDHGLACASSDVVLDVADAQGLATGLQTLATRARATGSAIAIADVRPGLAAALQTGLPQLSEAGIEVVPASAVVAVRALSRR